MEERSITYTTTGTCAKRISVSVDENDIVTSVAFVNGCEGNHKGLVSLCVGMPAQEVVKRLSGITCGMRPTSCPDQLSKAIELLLAQ